MTDFYVDPVTNDLSLVAGDIRYTNLEEQTRQRLFITLNTYRGEWFPNRFYGIPYLINDDNNIQLLGKSREGLLGAFIRSAILGTDNIEELISFNVREDPLTRTVKVEFEATMTNGKSFTQTVVL